MLVSTFSKRLEEALKLRNITPAEIVRRSELLFEDGKINKPLNKPLMTNYLKSKYEAKQDNVYTLSLILNVDEAWLMGYDVPIKKELKGLNIDMNKQVHWTPVYGSISAGQPNWAEECIEGRLPIDPVLFNIINPEEHFFLRVNGESMNKVIANGAYALIHKQDIVENGEIAVVLVNGDEATLKKFSKQGELIVLEPMSDDNSFQVQVYDKTTPIKVLGKYVGKFEMNK